MNFHVYEYVILGGGVVAGYAAQELVKQEIEPGQLCIVSADNTLPYDRPPLSKGYLAGEKTTEDILINPPEFYQNHDITVLLETRITRVDLPSRRLYGDKDEVIQFGQLLIATGSRVRTFDLPGSDLPGIHYLRDSDHARQIAAEMQSAKRAVVIGGGYIGMEVASVLAVKDIEVTMVFHGERLMDDFFTPEMAAFFQQYYEEHGVRFLPQTEPTAFLGGEHLTGVELDNGETLPADLVVVGIGVEPATTLFQGSGIHVQDGIVVNKYLETNWDGIYAAGDVANYYDVIFQKRRRVDHWDNAVKQGQHAAQMMTAGRKRDQCMYLRYFFSDVFDLSYEFWGNIQRADQVVYRGDIAGGSFSAWWLDGNRVDGVFVMDRPDKERDLAPEWIKSRRRVVPEQLADESIPLSKMVPLALF
jgi:NADPH-dependent 2,4-dienoyl-CoA reductase/sulfur reductase-like enzyme